MNDSQDPTTPSQPLNPPPTPTPSTTVLPDNVASPGIDPLSTNPDVPSQTPPPLSDPSVPPPPSALPDSPPMGSTIGVEPAANSFDPAQSDTSSTSSVLWAFLLGIFNWLVVPFGIVLILHFFVFQAFHVVGHSMIPTLEQNDYLIISKVDATLSHLSRIWGKNGNYIPQRDQIIVFRYPGNPQQVFVKRVIALPGERVVVKGGQVTVFNSTHPAGLNPDAGHQTSDPISLGDVDETVQPGKVFVMGDNRSPGGSFDSRDWGELPSENIIGTAFVRLLPFDKLKVLGTS